MPSPFPGMDPYLEHPRVFPDLHDSFVIYLREALQPKLREPYYVRARSRTWIELPDSSIEPDASVLRGNGRESRGDDSSAAGSVAVAVQRQPVVVTVPLEERRESFLEVFVDDGGPRLVTAIEVLSPTNKRPGDHGREKYRRKQRRLLWRDVNLVEIDLLRGGRHTTAVPLESAEQKAGPFDYHVCIRRFDKLDQYLVYPIRLPERLPEILIPLLPGDDAVAADLQAVFNRCYDTGPYKRSVRYRDAPPPPALTPNQSEWAQQCLRNAGLADA